MQTKSSRLASALLVYTKGQILRVLLLGFSSGLPLLLIGSTLAARLTESGLDLSTIGLFALVGSPYALKFLWAPVADQLYLPFIKNHLAHRKSWVWLSQIALILCFLGLALFDVKSQTFTIALLSFATAFFSSLQDITIDALRVEMLEEDDQGAGAGAAVLGYRIGMLIAGAGAMLAATYMSWEAVYALATVFMLPGIITVFTIKELSSKATAYQESTEKDKISIVKEPGVWVQNAVILPFVDFLKRDAALFILLFIALYKLSDALAGAMTMPFYLQMGYTKAEIAAVSKVFGLVASIVGALIGGMLVKGIGMMRSLLLCGILQIVSNFAFVFVAVVDHSTLYLALAIAVENVSGGMGTAAFVAYLSSLCNVKYTATQYALLSSLSSLGRSFLASGSGVLADVYGWPLFFSMTAVVGVPALLLLWILAQRERKAVLATS